MNVLVRFAAVIAVAIMVLGVLNALPQFLGGEPLGVIRYASAEDAEARLHVTLFRAAAMPQPWHWPPTRVRAAIGRIDWVAFDFDADTILCQATGEAPGAEPPPPLLLPSGTLLQESSFTVPGRTMATRRVLLDDGTIVHELWWREHARRVMLRGHVPADGLPALARALVGNR